MPWSCNIGCPKIPQGYLSCVTVLSCVFIQHLSPASHTHTNLLYVTVCLYVCLFVCLFTSNFFMIIFFSNIILFHLLSMLPFLPLFPFYLSILSLVLPQKNMTLENVIKNRIDFDCREKDRECQIASSDQKLTDRIWKHRITKIEFVNIK